MAWFSKKKALPGWMVVSTDPDAIRLACIDRSTLGKPKVDRWGIVMQNESEDAELEKVAEEYKLGRYRCATLLHPAEYQLLMVDAPSVPREELKAAIRWRVKDLLDYHIDDATMDVLDIPVEKDTAGKSHYMYAVVAKNEIVQGQIARFEQAKIPLQVIDIPETAQRNIAELYETAERGVGMLTFDHAGGLFTLSFRGELYLARRLELTWSQLVGSRENQRQTYFERIGVELQRSLDHFERQYQNIALSELLLGPLPEDIGLLAFLSSQLYLPLRQINLADALEFAGDDMGVEKQWQLFHVLGAALRLEAEGAMSQQINLFNPIFLKQKKTFSAVNMLDALALLLVGVAAFYAYASIKTVNLDRQAVEAARQYDQAKQRLAQTSARYAPKKTDAGLEAEVSNLQAQLSARKTGLNNLGIGALARDTGYAEYMRALARQSLAGLWLTGFKVAKGGAEMEIIGRALQPELVPSYIRRLNRERAMQGRAFESLILTQREAALPADASRPASAPASYGYTEFRLGTSHGELPTQAETEPAAKAASESPRDASSRPPLQPQAGSAGSK